MVGNNIAISERRHPSHNRGPGWGATVMADKGILLLMLYDKAISCMEEAIELIKAKDYVGKGERIIRAQEIVTQLCDVLDRDSGEPGARALALNLERLYAYVYTRLIRGNNHLDCEALEDSIRIMSNLYEAWGQVALSPDGS
mgnify:CR=1 FL=1